MDVAKLSPNVWLVDPLRDLILFQRWPADWARSLGVGVGFAVAGLTLGWSLAIRMLRRPG